MAIRKCGKFYQIDFYYKGKRIRRLIKTTLKRIAEAYLNDLLNKKVKGELYLDGYITLNEYKDLYLDFKREEAESKAGFTFTTLKRYGQILVTFSRFIKENTRAVYLSDITEQDINDYKHKRASEIAIPSVNSELRTLKAFFNEALKRNFIHRNPVRGVTFLEEIEKPYRKLDIETYKRILLEARLRYSKDSFVPALVTLIYSGCRKTEVLRLKWEQVDLENNVLRIYSSNDFRTKTGKKRIIPIHSAIRNELEKLPKESEYVFLGLKGEPYNIRFFNKRFKIIVNYLNAPWVRVHDLRHSLASYLAEKGISYTTIAAILGHASIVTTLTFYQHTSPPELKTAIDLIPNFEVY